MNFAQLFKKSNSSLNQLEGNVLHSSISEVRGDLVVVDTGLAKSSVCFRSELKTNTITRKSPQRAFGAPHEVVIGIDQVESVHGEPVLLYPKMLQKISRRKLVWNELTTIWRNSPSEFSSPAVFRSGTATLSSNLRTFSEGLVRGFILNPVKGGYAVAIAGYIAFLPRSLRIQRKVRLGQWRNFSILNMNPKIDNIVVKEYFPRINKNVHHFKAEEAKTAHNKPFFKSRKVRLGSGSGSKKEHVHHSKKQMKRS